MGRKRPTRIPRLPPAKRMILRTIGLHGVPDFEAPPRGGCTPFLQVLPAPSQHYQPHLLYNSSWQKPNFETYLADPDGSILFEVNTEVQGDVLVRCFHANTTNIVGKHMVKMFHFTFNTDFFHKYSNMYRLPKAEVDEAAGNPRYPDDFQVICHVEMLDPNGNPFPPKSSSVLQSERRNGTLDDVVEQAKDVCSRFTPRPRRMTAPSRQSCCEQKARPETSCQLEETAPTMQGWLYKQGGFVKNWKKRWFVAQGGKMMYYHGISDATPLGVVNLRRVTVQMCEPHEVNARNKCLHFFKVVPRSADQRTYFFGAESEQDLVAWIHVIGAQSAYYIVNDVLSRRPFMPHNNTFATRASYQQVHQTPHREEDRHRRASSDRSRSYHVSDTRSSLSSIAFEDSIRSEASDTVRSSWSDNGGRESMLSNLSGDAERARKFRIQSFTDYDDHEEDRLSSTSASAVARCLPAEPVGDLMNTLSVREQALLLQEINGFEAGIYIYSADELLEAAQLQKYMRETPSTSFHTGSDPHSAADGLKHPSTLSRQLRHYVAQKQMGYAEQLLIELVLTKFPGLIDAMDHDPLAFTRLIASGDIELAGHRLQG
ncbi:unnamed protein product [Peronospora belbahrii]|uniref:PH domain-containing protein n=1 Tax=Peronospora belbahrii TaxID=622444 RepID=A0AAU9LB23_9STRA|nr:unnamed protein product [Peronospora belbahrii]